MKMMKQKGVISTIEYQMVFAAIVGAALLAIENFQVMLDTELARFTSEIQSELAAITDADAGTSDILDITADTVPVP